MGRLLQKYRNLSRPVKASLWFMICGFLQRGISVLTTPIFTRILTTDQYGTYSAFNSWLEVLTVFITLKLAAGVYTQGLVKHDEDRDVFTSSLLGLATASTAIWFIIYLIFHRFFNSLLEFSTVLRIAMFAMMWSTIAFNFWASKERVDYHYKKLVVLTIAVTISKPLFGVLAVILTPVYKAEARIISLAIIEFVAYIGLFIVLMRRGKVFYHKEYWKYALNFNLPLIPHYLSKNILNHSDRIMIKSIVYAGAAGIYSLAYNISTMLTILNTSIANSLTPWMYKCLKKGEIKRINKITVIILVLIGGINLLLIAVAPEAVAIFAPKSYGEAIYVIPPATMAVFFQFLYTLFANFEFYFEKTKWIMYASVAGAVLNVGLNAIFIPVFGYIAAAYTTLICYIVYSILHYYFMRKVCREYCNGEQPYNIRVILVMSFFFLVIGFGLMALFPYWYARYSIVLASFAFAYIKRRSIKDALKILSKKKTDKVEEENA